MAEEERMITIIGDIKRDVEELTSRNTSVISNTNQTLESVIDDIRAIPEYVNTLKKNLEDLKQINADLEQQIIQTNQAIETVSAEIEINRSKKRELEETEIEKRNKKQDLEASISNQQNEKNRLEQELEHLSSSAKNKEEAYNHLEVKSKQDLEDMEQKINESQAILTQAKEDNKLIVYLMDAGLLDVPEAEIVSIVASSPDGLKLDEIKSKVTMATVRVQPVLNNLLEKVLEYDSYSDSYRILEALRKEFH
jgi:chromosome segregation ATPase